MYRDRLQATYETSDTLPRDIAEEIQYSPVATLDEKTSSNPSTLGFWWRNKTPHAAISQSTIATTLPPGYRLATVTEQYYPTPALSKAPSQSSSKLINANKYLMLLLQRIPAEQSVVNAKTDVFRFRKAHNETKRNDNNHNHNLFSNKMFPLSLGIGERNRSRRLPRHRLISILSLAVEPSTALVSLLWYAFIRTPSACVFVLCSWHMKDVCWKKKKTANKHCANVMTLNARQKYEFFILICFVRAPKHPTKDDDFLFGFFCLVLVEYGDCDVWIGNANRNRTNDKHSDERWGNLSTSSIR